jgi:hypothetical protein
MHSFSSSILVEEATQQVASVDCSSLLPAEEHLADGRIRR